MVKAYVAMKAQKVHDEVMKQPHVAARSRPGVGSDALKEYTQPDLRATHQCPECFTDWGNKVLPIKKTKHLVNMDHPTGNWLLFVTGNGITWPSLIRQDFKLRHSVDFGLLAEAPLCPADHAETSLSDFVLSKDRLQLRTEVLNRVVDAETFPSEVQSRPQNSKDCKKEQAALVFHPDAAAGNPKRPEEEMMQVVQDNALQCGALSVRKFLEGPGSNQSAWEALNRTVNMRMREGRTSST